MEVSEPRSAAALTVRSSSRAPLFAAALGVLLVAFILLAAGAPAVQRAAGTPARTLSAAPLGLRAAASAAVGAGESRYAVDRKQGSLVTRNGKTSTTFGASGPLVQSGHLELGLQLAGVGYGTTLAQPTTPVRSAVGNKVSYLRGPLTEWYRNGPLGLEQGFVLRSRPAGAAAGRLLTVAVRASGSLRPALHGSEIVFARSVGGPVVFRYGGLSAFDAAGRSLPVRMVLQGHTILLRIDDADARYPLTIDPYVQQGAKLTGDGEVGAGTFGARVALSADGNTALVGAPEDNNLVGAVWVFVRSGATWAQEGPKLTAGDEVGPGEFGAAVALSGDGNTAVIGGPADGGAYDGAAWIFTRSGQTWAEQAKLTPNDETLGAGQNMGATFGESVALSADGDTALIGGPANAGLGAAWIFARAGSSWAQQGTKITGVSLGPNSTLEGTGFGQSVALSADGNTALIGGPADSWFNGAYIGGAGSAWVFTRTGSTWTQQGSKLFIYDASGGFGMSVALSADGNTALIAGPETAVVVAPGNVDEGAAWVFTRTGSTWAQQGSELTADDETERAYFGDSVSLTADGNTALLGGGGDTAQTGAAWLFSRSGSTWSQDGSKLTGSGEVGAGDFGNATALSSDGSTILLGGALDNNFTGAAWVFTDTDGSVPDPSSPSNPVTPSAPKAAPPTPQPVTTTQPSSVPAPVVATPPVHCVVPKLAGETLALARTAISHAHCNVGHITRKPSARVAKGRVSAESPRPGSKLGKGSKIDFTLSTGKPKRR